jgi:hypothetical protein
MTVVLSFNRLIPEQDHSISKPRSPIQTNGHQKNRTLRSLWQSCDELRGGMDASQYKDYVLTLLFVKYVSDKYAGDPYGVIEVPAGGSFADMVR